MKYICCNIVTENNKELKKYFINNILKDIAYNSISVNVKDSCIYYNFCLIPYLTIDNIETAGDIPYVNEKITRFIGQTRDINIAYSITKLLSNGLSKIKTVTSTGKKISMSISEFTNKFNFSFDVCFIIDSSKMDIFYTDGSSDGKKGRSGFATIKLGNTNDDGVYDKFSDSKREYSLWYGHIDDGTNNIGELYGIKTAVDNFGNNQFQVIISDSDYSIKSFREWYENWYKNNFIGSYHREILNRDIIENVGETIRKSNKIVVFKWVKAHSKKDKNELNDLCDEYAKKGKLGE